MRGRPCCATYELLRSSTPDESCHDELCSTRGSLLRAHLLTRSLHSEKNLHSYFILGSECRAAFSLPHTSHAFLPSNSFEALSHSPPRHTCPRLLLVCAQPGLGRRTGDRSLRRASGCNVRAADRTKPIQGECAIMYAARDNGQTCRAARRQIRAACRQRKKGNWCKSDG